ncbi:hypothetical protein AV530_004216 [Patagioenas fasciata monilis]|nr:hypothetical protein AV530_004216 [Patagioenas fasciata monilis]
MEDDEERDGSQEATETMDTKQTMMPKSFGTDGDELLQDKDSFWKELSQIEKARICAQREVIVMSAKVEGSCAALDSVERTLEALEENQVGPVFPFLHHPLQQGLPVLRQSLLSNARAQLTWQEGLAELAMHPDTSLSCHLPAQHAVKAELLRQAAVLQKQLHAQRCDIMQTLTHRLPPLLRAEACLSLLPVLQRQLSLEAAHLQDIEGRQQKAAAWLVSQHSRLELLELQLKRERKQLDQRAAQLGEMAMAMREAQTRLREQQQYFRDASSSQKSCTCIWIDPKDLSAVRLWDMLVGQDRKEQLFRSYETLAAQWSQLVQDQRVLEAQLAAPMSQLPDLETFTEELYGLLYNSSNELQLTSPEITKLMQQLSTMQDNLWQMLADLRSDLKVKRSALENPLLQTEHNLYVYFYCNEDRLREVVEELEKQASAFSEGPMNEQPYEKE